MIRFFLAFSISLAISLPAFAEKRQFGNIIYNAPEGWRIGGVYDGTQRIFSDLPDDRCEFCRIYIGTGTPGQASVIDFLNENKERFVDEDDRDDIEPMQRPNLVLERPMEVGMFALLADGRMHINLAIGLPDRIEYMGFSGRARDPEDLTESMETFQELVLPMLLGVKFVSLGAEPLMPEPEPGDLSGLYWGWETEFVLGVDGMMRNEIDHSHIVFWPDGYFYSGQPPNGLQPLDPEGLTAVGDTDFGVYTLQGRTVQLTYFDGVTDTLRMDDGALVDGALRMIEVEPLEDGSRIEGSISSFFFSGFSPGSGISGGASASSFTAFHEDGTYSGDRSGGTFGNFDGGGGFASSNNNDHAGTYEIRDGMIIMTAKDGSMFKSSMIYDDGDGDIMIGSQFLETD